KREKTKAWQRAGLRQILIQPAHTPIISHVMTNAPAAIAGLKSGDALLAANGERIYSITGLEVLVEKNGTAPMTLTVKHGDQTNQVSITPKVLKLPEEKEAKPNLGIDEWTIGMKIVRPGVTAQIYDSVDAMISTFGALFSRKSDIKAQHLSGAIKIMNIYYVLFRSEQGWRLALWFSVIMNVNLALLNLLPIPVLDGGHIVLAIVEGVRRKPVNPRILQILQTSCAVLIIGYMLYIAFYDAQELWPSRRKPAEVETPPQPEPGPAAPNPSQP
ncbi:MAG: site-2 protease family protein, partial [Phycisphaerales bacterium]|nr:site-2 protease family protein [Phycisphaerales bacterium]